MRIDVTALPQALGLVTAPAQPGHTLPFDAFFSQTQGGDGEAGTKAAPVLSQYVFGFDAVGMLGLGGPAGVGAPLGSLPQNGDGGDAVPGVQPPHPAKLTAPTPSAPVYASVPYAAFSPSSHAEAPVTAPVVNDMTAAPDRTAPQPGARGSGALPWTSASQPLPASTARVQVVSTSSPMAELPAIPNVRGPGGDTARDVPASRKAPAAFRFEPEAEASSGQVSVTVSEGEELLHIVAAAPGLTESDRQILRAVADEAAAEAGVPLGGLRLNGTIVRHLSKTR